MRNQDIYNTKIVSDILIKDGIILLDKYIGVKHRILCKDFDDYYFYITFSNYMSRGDKGKKFSTKNDYSIQNINNYLRINNVHFTCIEDHFVSANEPMNFKCLKCGNIESVPWRNVNKNDNSSRSHVLCSNCDGRTESLHAIILKQLFQNIYSDTIVEDKTYRNPNTNKICPTDIVNHRLKIAIEIQSQWHDFEDVKIKDKMKKNFWVSNGYKFYDPDIRDYSILEMCQLFFDITEIPNWVNYNYSNKINILKCQEYLDNGLTVSEVANILNVNKHRIYDAIQNKKLFYPKGYKNIKNVKQEYIKKSKESSETAGCA